MSVQSWQELVHKITADGSAVGASSTTETALLTAPTIPANYMENGRVLRVTCYGKISTNGTPTVKFGLRWGPATTGVLLAETAALTNGSGVTNMNWMFEALIQVRSNGATGTAMAMGKATLNTSSSASVNQVFSVSGEDAPAAATCDFTADTSLTPVITFGASHASNTVTGTIFIIESLN
jgi:hypothetical protein